MLTLGNPHLAVFPTISLAGCFDPIARPQSIEQHQAPIFQSCNSLAAALPVGDTLVIFFARSVLWRVRFSARSCPKVTHGLPRLCGPEVGEYGLILWLHTGVCGGVMLTNPVRCGRNNAVGRCRPIPVDCEVVGEHFLRGDARK